MNALASAHDASVQMIDTSRLFGCISTGPASSETEGSPWDGHAAG
jgi:hypothetical protein